MEINDRSPIRENLDACPNCEASLIGDPIPERHRQHKDNCAEQVEKWGRCFCLPYGNSTHFRRDIGYEVSGVYDGVLFWFCPDCGWAWHRWNDGQRREAAQRYIDEFRSNVYAQRGSD